MNLSKFPLLASFIVSAVTPVVACDLCGCYTPQIEIAHERPCSFYAGVAEQFTHFGTERLNGVEQPNPAGEYIDSSNTQIVAGAWFLKNRVGLQLSVPVIYRSFQRQLGFEIDHGRVSGLGDITLTANFVAFHKEAVVDDAGESLTKDGKAPVAPHPGEGDWSVSINLTGGLKLPTGDTSRLKENFAEEVEGAPETGIGPHDLTLGTGSVDGVFGLQAEARYKSVFFQGEVQYTVRGYGDYNYRFANDLSWSGGPGVYLVRKSDRSLALQCAVSGETKGYDHFQGVPDPDSGVTALYVGPRLLAAFGRVTGEVGVDLPVIMNTTSFQTTADYRIRAALTIRF